MQALTLAILAALTLHPATRLVFEAGWFIPNLAATAVVFLLVLVLEDL